MPYLLNFLKPPTHNSWHKHNLMISSFVGSGQYSWGISFEYLLGWGNLLGKIISIKRNHYSNLFVFFSIGNFPCRMCCDIFRTALFLEKLLLHNFLEWQLRHNSYIFGAAVSFLLSHNSHFFAAFIFSE